jgi:GNAT superfamily N-acetyltransferase
MMLPLGWSTDFAVLALGGSTIEEHADHVLVRTPANPTYHWGNFVLVTSATRTPDEWVALFDEYFPASLHRALGMTEEPDEAEGWAAHGLVFEGAPVLAATAAPEPRSLPVGYSEREIEDADWSASTAMRNRVWPGHPEFEERTTRSRTSLVAAGAGAWFGAYDAAGGLAAELGIVDCGSGIARYQSVLTDLEHRRLGLTSHLLGTAATWALARGCTRMVIVADQDSDAGRLYQALGFSRAGTSWQASRAETY